MGWATVDVAVVPRLSRWPGVAAEGRLVSAGESGGGLGSVEEVSKAGVVVAGGRGAAAALFPSGVAGFGGEDIFCSIVAMRSNISWRAGSCCRSSMRWRCRRPEDLVIVDFAEDAEALES